MNKCNRQYLSRMNVEGHSIYFSYCLEVNNTLRSILCFLFLLYLVLLLNLGCHLSQEVLFHPLLHGGLGSLKKARRHEFIRWIFVLKPKIFLSLQFLFYQSIQNLPGNPAMPGDPLGPGEPGIPGIPALPFSPLSPDKPGLPILPGSP